MNKSGHAVTGSRLIKPVVEVINRLLETYVCVCAADVNVHIPYAAILRTSQTPAGFCSSSSGGGGSGWNICSDLWQLFLTNVFDNTEAVGDRPWAISIVQQPEKKENGT